MDKGKLTQKQKKLLDLFFETKTSAKVLRRETLADGSYKFYDIIRNTRPVDFPITDSEFALKIHEVKPDAPLSSFYVNLRNLPEELLDKIAQVLAEVSLDQIPDLCTGIPKTAVVMAQKYSSISGIPFLDLFDKTGSGTDRRIEVKTDVSRGDGKTLIIIDDVVSQARSKFEAVKAAKGAGYTVAGILILVDRQQGGTEDLEKAGYKVYSAFKVTDIMNYYLESGKITKEQYNKVVEYIYAS